MPVFASRVTKCVLIAAQAVVLSSLIVGAGGCADALVYAKDSQKQGLGLYNDGSYPEAAASFANATRQDPSDYKSYYYLGASYQNMSKYQQAISAYRSCLDVMPMTLAGQNDTPLRYRTIDALATSIAKSETRDLETVALEKKVAGKAQVEDQWLLAKTYRYMGDADAAIDAYNKAVLIDPQNFTIAKEAGLYEAGLGQGPRATFALKKAYAIKSNDEQVNSALRSLGVVAGPSLKDEHDLAHPAMPQGPLPEWNANAAHTNAGDSTTVQVPRE